MVDQQSEEYYFRTRHRGRWYGSIWLPTLVVGMAIIVAAVMLALMNQRSGSRFYGLTADAQATATLGGSPADLGDLRSFETFNAFIPGLAFLGLGLVVAGVMFATARATESIRIATDDLQRGLGHSALGPEYTAAVRAAALLSLFGLLALVAAFVLGTIRASYLSDWYSLTAADRAAATGSRLARFGLAQAWEAWLPAFRWLGIGLVLSAIAFGVRELLEQFRYLTWRLRDMASGEPHEAPGTIYVLTRSD